MKTQNKKRNRLIIISFLMILAITLPSFLPCFTSVVSASSSVEKATTTLIPSTTITTTTPPTPSPTPTSTVLPNQITCLAMGATGSSFDGGYTINVFLTYNRTGEFWEDWDVTDWKFYLSIDYNITSIKNAEYTISRDGNYYIITPDSSIRTILPGDTVSFSFTAKGNMPKTLSCHELEYSNMYRNGSLSAFINGTMPSISPSATPSPTPSPTPNVTPSITPALELTSDSSSWNNGYCMTIFVKNISDLPIDDWVLIVNSDYFSISNIWSATYKESGDFYYITPDTWAQTITAGNSANFGFNATGSMPSQFNYTLKYYIDGTEYTFNDTLH